MHLVQTVLAVLVVGFFTLLGIPLTAIGMTVFLQRCHLTLFGERSSGKVIGWVDNAKDQTSQRSTTESSAFLRIAFTDCFAREHQVTTDTSVSPKNYHSGDTVPLLYRAARPSSFVVDRFWMKWTIPLLFGGAGLILLLPLAWTIARAWPN